MFDFGLGELLLVLFLIIIFIRPEDFPALLRKGGKLYGQAMRIYYSVLDEIQDVADLNMKEPRDKK